MENQKSVEASNDSQNVGESDSLDQMNSISCSSTPSCDMKSGNLEDSMFGFNVLVTPHPLDFSPIFPVITENRKTDVCCPLVPRFSSTIAKEIPTNAKQRRKRKKQLLNLEHSKAGSEEAENKLYKDLLSQFESVKNHELVIEEEK